MAKNIEVKHIQEKFQLLPERALVWSSENALLLGDLHFGKAEQFQSFGFPVPSGHSLGDLKRITQLMHTYSLSSLYLLGDIFHNPKQLSRQSRELFLHWWIMQSFQVHFILGNHDNALTDVLPELAKTTHREIEIKKVVLRHEAKNDSSKFQITAHIHPCFKLRRGRQQWRLPCFVKSEKELMLPAFGEFTGGYEVRADPRHIIYCVAEDAVIEIKG